MKEFFRGWRRKVGVVTLLMACVAMGGWVRSLYFIDSMAITLTKNRYSARSYRHQILWDHQHVDVGKLYHPFFSKFSVAIAELTQPFAEPLDELRERDWCIVAGDFYIASGTEVAGYYSLFVPKPGPPVRYSVVIAQTPYWSVTIPLTLASLWLLLSKPRKSTQKKTAGPIPVKRT